MQILLVDDSRTERRILSSWLTDLGHQVEEAEDGLQAVARCAELSPDLLLLDVEMPRLNGYQTAQRLREELSDWLPIIFLSARNSAEDIARGIDAGGDDYLFKPVDPIVLAAKMRAMERIAGMRHKLLDTGRQLAEANAELDRQANIDGLTGLANRRQLDTRLAEEMARSTRHKTPLSVMLADVDHFKHYNDHYGHQAGDQCLKQVARCLSRSVHRPGDLAARYGGEEFCVLLPETPLQAATELAERIRDTLAARQIPHARAAAADIVTLSLGVAVYASDSDAQGEQLLRRADQALYRAKQQGRNRVCT